MSELENISDSSERKIDIKELIRKFTGYWYYFLISVLICLFLAFLYNRYNRNIYEVYTYILIEDEKNPNLNLRVFITGGGCSGFQYGFTFDEKI